jgi:hypothetical protein
MEGLPKLTSEERQRCLDVAEANILDDEAVQRNLRKGKGKAVTPWDAVDDAGTPAVRNRTPRYDLPLGRDLVRTTNSPCDKCFPTRQPDPDARCSCQWIPEDARIETMEQYALIPKVQEMLSKAYTIRYTRPHIQIPSGIQDEFDAPTAYDAFVLGMVRRATLIKSGRGNFYFSSNPNLEEVCCVLHDRILQRVNDSARDVPMHELHAEYHWLSWLYYINSAVRAIINDLYDGHANMGVALHKQRGGGRSWTQPNRRYNNNNNNNPAENKGGGRGRGKRVENGNGERSTRTRSRFRTPGAWADKPSSRGSRTSGARTRTASSAWDGRRPLRTFPAAKPVAVCRRAFFFLCQ